MTDLDPATELEATLDELERVQDELETQRRHRKHWQQRATKNMRAISQIESAVRAYRDTYDDPLTRATLTALAVYVSQLKGELFNDKRG
ncbi:hypothetical protein [Flaviflexus huanghaiensis]|uniref:hypothetical protein n=1 Tax=Flaviflexus huanghaiensis TaxID=1111473 RepID=UPI0015F95338|nr:hypothetical protein [Flaviflexus huanghaiensis]